MKTIDKYNQELGEILYLKDVKKEEFRFSNILLFREYQSRLFAWKYAIKSSRSSRFNKDKNFHNLFIDLAPDWIDELIPEQKVVEDLNKLGFNTLYHSFRDYEGFFISMFLNWKIFEERPEILKYQNLPHPYEPVFNMLKRGGSIYYISMKFFIDNRMTYREYDYDFTLPSLGEDFLDFVDRNVSDFPNQELINELWIKFQKNH